METLALTMLLFSSAILCAQETLLPPQFEFIPLPNAVALARHPTLPVLYVGCEDAPSSKNLITYRLGADGALDAESRRDCADYFSLDGKTPSFRHCLYRPSVNAEKSLLYLAAYPTTANAVTTYADTNNFEFAAVRLDSDGQPREPLKLFRSEGTGQMGLMDSVRFEPSVNRIFLTYYSTINWLDLDEEGLPLPGANRWIPWLVEYQRWQYVPAWERFFAVRTTSMLINFVWHIGSPGVEFIQAMQVTSSPPQAGVLPIHRESRKLYLLDPTADRALVVVPLDPRGAFIGLPRRLDIGAATRIEFDFTRRILYVFERNALRLYPLGEDGYPRGDPQIIPLAVGGIRDVWVDERTGKLYIACVRPPGLGPK